MPRYYSKDMRIAVLRCVEEGKRHSEIVEFFGISLKTLSNWLRLNKENASLLPNRRNSYSCSQRLRESLLHEINSHSDIMLEELSKKYRRSISTIHYHLKKLSITRKKNDFIQRARRGKKTEVSVRH